MNRVLLLTPIVLGGVFVARHLLTADRRDRLSQLPATMIRHCMERMPEDFPPKVMTSGVRRIQVQNDQILAALREQNALLRGRATKRSAPKSPRRARPPRRPASG